MERHMKTMKYSKEKINQIRKWKLTLQNEIQVLDYKICNIDFEIRSKCSCGVQSRKRRTEKHTWK